MDKLPSVNIWQGSIGFKSFSPSRRTSASFLKFLSLSSHIYKMHLQNTSLRVFENANNNGNSQTNIKEKKLTMNINYLK